MKKASARTLSKPDNMQDILDLVEMMKHNNQLSWRTSSVYIEPIKDAFRLSFFRDKVKIVGKIQKLEQLLKKMDTLKTKQSKDKSKFNKQIWDKHETSPRTFFSRVEKEIDKVVTDIDSALKTAVNKTSYNHNRMRKQAMEKTNSSIHFISADNDSQWVFVNKEMLSKIAINLRKYYEGIWGKEFTNKLLNGIEEAKPKKKKKNKPPRKKKKRSTAKLHAHNEVEWQDQYGRKYQGKVKQLLGGFAMVASKDGEYLLQTDKLTKKIKYVI